MPHSVVCERCSRPTTDLSDHLDRNHTDEVVVEMWPGEWPTVRRSGDSFSLSVARRQAKTRPKQHSLKERP